MLKIFYLICLQIAFSHTAPRVIFFYELLDDVKNMFEKQCTFSTHHDEILDFQYNVDVRGFSANLCGSQQIYYGDIYADMPPINYKEFLFHLALQRKQFVKCLETNISNPESMKGFNISQKVESPMSFTTIINYYFKVNHVTIKSILIDGGCWNKIDESHVEDTWIPKKNTSSIEEGKAFARNVTKSLPFREIIDDSLFRVNMFTHDFSALIDTNYNITYSNLVDFMKYMRRFNQRYRKESDTFQSELSVNENHSNITIITQSCDHIVFRTRIPFLYKDMLNFENWDFQIEIIFNHNNLEQWRIAKIFMRPEHFKTIAEIHKRAADELFTGIREEMQRLSRLGEFTTFDSNLMGRVEFLELCERFHGPDNGLSLKFFNRSEETLYTFLYTTSSVTHGDPAQLNMNIFFEINFVMEVVPTTFILAYDDYEDEYYIKNVSIPCSRVPNPELR